MTQRIPAAIKANAELQQQKQIWKFVNKKIAVIIFVTSLTNKKQQNFITSFNATSVIIYVFITVNIIDPNKTIQMT